MRGNYPDFLDILYPARCPLCDRLIKASERLVCPECIDKIPFIKGPLCGKCGRPLKDTENGCCDECKMRRHVFDRALAPFRYEGAVKESLMNFKFRHRAEYYYFYAAAIAAYAEDAVKVWMPDIIIPVPAHRKRETERGYNQAYLTAGELGRFLEIPVCRDLVLRVKNTKALKELGYRERLETLKGAFKINRKYEVPERILIVDDILTSGSTLDSMSALLKDAGAERVYALCISVRC